MECQSHDAKTVQTSTRLYLDCPYFYAGYILFFVLLIIKICHIYLDYSKVKDALVSVEKTVDIQTLSEAEVRPALSKRFDLNYAKHATLQDVKITKEVT